MLFDLSPRMRSRMAELEQIDQRDRRGGTDQDHRLRQIPPETGRFLALLAALSPSGRIVEVGTSGGYSTLWLALAARATGRMVLTFEVLPNKVDLARETFRQAGVTDLVEQVHGDAREHLGSIDGIGFCFLDLEKDLYPPCYDLAVPNLVPGGLLVADNLLSHAAQLGPFVEMAEADPRTDSVVVPVGKGLLLCRRAA